MKPEELDARCHEMKARMARKKGQIESQPPFDIVARIEAVASQKRFVNQAGQLMRGRDGWMVRFYVTDPLQRNADGNWGKRVKQSERLCSLEVERDKALKKMREFMKAENAKQQRAWVDPSSTKQTVVRYWEDTYFPVIVETRSWSTQKNYRNLWKTYCAEYFKNKVLVDFETKHASQFLKSLTEKVMKRGPHKGERGLAQASLNHIRATCSGLFSHALNEGLIDRNPFSEVKLWVKYRRKAPTVKYTLVEVIQMLAAIPRTDAKLVTALCCLAGLMPGECAAARWEGIRGNVLEITESAPSGHLGETKTERRQGTVLLIAPVMRLLEAYRLECGKATGFLFQKNGSPRNMDYFASDFIKPFARKVIGDRWAGLYAARRACGTLLFNLTGDTRATYQVLRNTEAISKKHYVGADVAQGRAGQLILEQAFEKEAERLQLNS